MANNVPVSHAGLESLRYLVVVEILNIEGQLFILCSDTCRKEISLNSENLFKRVSQRFSQH